MATNNINSYINFPRRFYLVYKKIKKKIKYDSEFKVIFKAYKWNMASNSLHFLDLFNYLNENSKIRLKYKKLNNIIYKSKRDNFFELRGILEFVDSNKNYLHVSDSIKYKNDTYILIENKDYKFKIYESKKKFVEIKKTNVKKENLSFVSIPLQSTLTKKLIELIIKKEDTNLPSLEDSFIIHDMVLKTFNNHIYSLKKNKKIMIT